MIVFSTEQNYMKIIPREVHPIVNDYLQILINEWQITEETYRSEGGFILIIENESDYDILNYYNVDLETQIVEFTEKVVTTDGNWIHSLILLGDDFGIILFMKEEIATQNLLEYID